MSSLRKLQLTLAILKPDIVAQPHAAEDIRNIILRNNFLFVKSDKVHLTRERIGHFYAEHEGRFFYNRFGKLHDKWANYNPYSGQVWCNSPLASNNGTNQGVQDNLSRTSINSWPIWFNWHKKQYSWLRFWRISQKRNWILLSRLWYGEVVQNRRKNIQRRQHCI